MIDNLTRICILNCFDILKGSDMRIRVDEIPESGRFLHFHWDEDHLRQFLPPEDPFEIELVRPVNVDLEIQKRIDHIRITGTIRGVLRLGCHRCLKPFQWPMDETVDVFLLEEEKAPQEEELELEGEELDFEFFDGQIIEIDQLVAEQIFLALPFKVLCSEDCRGICPRCGVNLNDEECRCATEKEPSAFSRLEAIKSRLPGWSEE